MAWDCFVPDFLSFFEWGNSARELWVPVKIGPFQGSLATWRPQLTQGPWAPDGPCKAYQLLHGARALQPNERLADIFGEALEATLVAVKQPLLRCLVKRTGNWTSWHNISILYLCTYTCNHSNYTYKPPNDGIIWIRDDNEGRFFTDSHGMIMEYPYYTAQLHGGDLAKFWDRSAWRCKAWRWVWSKKELLFWEDRWWVMRYLGFALWIGGGKSICEWNLNPRLA